MAQQPKDVMIRINLLPADRAKMNLEWLPKVVFFSFILLVVGAVLAVNGYFVVQTMQLKQHKSEVQGRIAKLKPDVKRVKQIEQQIAVLHKKEDVINDLILNRIEWARKLNQLSDILPAQVWLEEVSLVRDKSRSTQEASKKMLRIIGLTRALGHARSLEATLIYNIQHSPFFEDFETVHLVSSQLTDWSGDRDETVWEFELHLPLKDADQRANELRKRQPAAKKSSGGAA